MGQMSISSKVGKNCCSQKKPDVILIQEALKGCKDGKYKSFYQGKIDGMCKAKTICAIEHFQSQHNLKMTGVVEAYGPTMNKLRMKTPQSLKTKLANSGGGSTGAGGTLDTNKVIQNNNKLADDILKRWPLPKREAESIAECVKKCSMAMVPLRAWPTPVTIDNAGRFVVRFDLAEWATPDKSPSSIPARKAMMAKVNDIVGKSGHWHKGDGNTMGFKSAMAYRSLSGAKEPDEVFLKKLGMTKANLKTPIELAIAHAAQKLYFS